MVHNASLCKCLSRLVGLAFRHKGSENGGACKDGETTECSGNTSKNETLSQPSVMKAACRCGACEIHLLHLEEPSQTYTADCHCVSCRTYHAAAFCSFLRRKDIHIEDDNNVASFSDVCGKLGPVQRLYCRKCFAKLATRTEGDEYYYVNMGSLVDELIRADYSAEWRQARHVWQADEPWKMAPWYPAHPDYLPPQRFPSFLRKLRSKPCDPTRMTKTSSTPTLQGGCACGKARFVIAD